MFLFIMIIANSGINPFRSFLDRQKNRHDKTRVIQSEISACLHFTIKKGVMITYVEVRKTEKKYAYLIIYDLRVTF